MATTMSVSYALMEENYTQFNVTLDDDDVSNATSPTLSLMNKISYGYIMQPICLLGVLCNVLNLFVLTHKKLSESPYVYLTALAISDLLTLIFFFLSGFSRAHYPDSYNWKFYECYIYFTLGGMSTNVSALLTVVLTIERYIFVAYPMKAREICTPQNARKVIIGITIFAVLFDTPRFFVFKIKKPVEVGYTEFSQHTFYEAINWFRLTVLLLGSCFLLTILNILLIKYVVESNKKRRVVQSTSNLKRIRDNNRLTMMLVAIIGIYIIGEIPSAFVSRAIIVPLLGEETTKKLPYRIALVIATILVVLEHSLNFVVYCIYNKKFRGILKFYIVKLYKKKAMELTTDADESRALNSASVPASKCCGFKENTSDDGPSMDYLNTEGFTLDQMSTNMNGSINYSDEKLYKDDMETEGEKTRLKSEMDSVLRDSNRNLTSEQDRDVSRDVGEN